MVHHVGGDRMAKPVCRALNTCTLEEVLRNRLDMQAPHLYRKCCTAGIEDPYRHGVESAEVDSERLTYILGQWKYPFTSALLSAYPDRTGLPIDILPLQMSNLFAAKAKPQKQQQQCSISTGDPLVPL